MSKWLSLLLLLSPFAHAAPTTLYYTGVMYMNFTGSDEVKKSDYLLARTLDSEKNEIQETVVNKPGDASYGEMSLGFKVNGSVYSYASEEIKGNGALIGEPWKWTNASGSFVIEDSMVSARFVQSDIFSDPESIIRHVDIYQAANGEPYDKLTEQIDIIVKRVPSYIYQMEREKLLGHP
jgi:hypothetical protein